MVPILRSLAMAPSSIGDSGPIAALIRRRVHLVAGIINHAGLAESPSRFLNSGLRDKTAASNNNPYTNLAKPGKGGFLMNSITL
jgi:hypothetical protein